MKSDRKFVESLLANADIKIGGNRPQDIIVHDERFFNRIVRYGSLGFGESYMDGWWDANSIDTLIHTVFNAHLEKKFEINIASVLSIIKAWLFNLQSRALAFTVGKVHYDLGNDLYEAMLDRRMIYTCGYWKDAGTLDEAQEAKLDLVCKKIGLKNGDHILDIGCGWGGFAKFASERYGASVVGITISKEQAIFARELCKGLPVKIKVQDYREINEKFDHIISLGMFEHVGQKNYVDYFKVANRCLKEDGVFLLHTIGYSCSFTSDPWFEKYIFPGGTVPSIAEIGRSIEGLFVMEDWHNFGADYDKTLMAWFTNFDTEWSNSTHIKGERLELNNKYGDRFYRMWKYYLLSMAGGFRARKMQLWQIVLSKNGIPCGYTSVR